MTEKNQRLTDRVRLLEAGECPDLEDVLAGLADEPCPAAERQGSAAARDGDDTDVGGVTTDQTQSCSESDSDVSLEEARAVTRAATRTQQCLNRIRKYAECGPTRDVSASMFCHTWWV